MEFPDGGTYETFRYVSNLLIVTNSLLYSHFVWVLKLMPV